MRGDLKDTIVKAVFELGKNNKIARASVLEAVAKAKAYPFITDLTSRYLSELISSNECSVVHENGREMLIFSEDFLTSSETCKELISRLIRTVFQRGEQHHWSDIRNHNQGWTKGHQIRGNQREV